MVLVDDDADIRRVLNVLLIQDGIEIIGEAGDGEQAISLTAELQPHAIVIDFMMPVLDGAAATLEITRRWPTIIVIGLTAGDASARQRLQASGAHVVFDKTEIIEVVEWIGRCRSQRPLTPLRPRPKKVISLGS